MLGKCNFWNSKLLEKFRTTSRSKPLPSIGSGTSPLNCGHHPQRWHVPKAELKGGRPVEIHLQVLHGYLHFNVQIWVQCWFWPKKLNSSIIFGIHLFLGTFWGTPVSWLCSGDRNFDVIKNLSHHLHRQGNVIVALGNIPTNLWWHSPTVACPQTPYIKRSARRGPCASSLWSLRIFD